MFRKKTQDAEAFAIQQWLSAHNCETDLAMLRAKVKAVNDAIEDKGRVPKYQEFVMKKHRDEWAALWEALDDLCAEYNK